METTKRTEVETYFKSNNIGVIIKYGKRQFANLSTGENYSNDIILSKLVDASISIAPVDLTIIKDNLEISQVASRVPQNTEAIIKAAMTSLGIEMRATNGAVSFNKEYTTFNIKEVVSKINVFLRDQGTLSITTTIISDVLSNMISDVKEADNKIFEAAIKTDPNLVPSAFEQAETLMKIVSGPEYREMYSIVMMHMIWLMKRKYYGYKPKDIKYPIFLNFYSKRANTGKSSFVSIFLSVIPSLLQKNENFLKDLIEDERKCFALMERLAIICGELGGLERADISTFKNIIDMDVVCMRNLGFNSDRQGTNYATLFGTSNRKLKETLRAGPDVRKWFEIPFHFYGSPEKQEQTSYLPLQAYDYVSLWKSIDEKMPSPLESRYAEYHKLASEICGCPENLMIEGFLKDYILEHHDKMDMSNMKAIFDEFRRTCPYSNTPSMILEMHMETAGFIKDMTPGKEGGKRWKVPTYTQSNLFTPEEVKEIQAAERKAKGHPAVDLFKDETETV